MGGGASARTEDSRSSTASLGLAMPSLDPPGGFPRPPAEVGPPEEGEELGDNEGEYDCTLS